MAQRIQLRRGTAAEWTAANPVLALGEPGVETDTGKQKFGNGTAVWTALPYASKGDQGIPGVADDASVKDLITTPGSQTATALSATYLPRPTGGSEGQVLAKSGAGLSWQTVTGSGVLTLIQGGGAADVAARSGAGGGTTLDGGSATSNDTGTAVNGGSSTTTDSSTAYDEGNAAA